MKLSTFFSCDEVINEMIIIIGQNNTLFNGIAEFSVSFVKLVSH